MSDEGVTLPKFGGWDVNDPASAEGFTVIFNKARDEKKSGANPKSRRKGETIINHSADPGKPPTLFQKIWFCCIQSSPAES